MTTARSGRPWASYALGALCVVAIVAAILLVGPASGSQSTPGRTITVGEGVVQSTVSGSGNVQAASELDLGFKTSGVVSQIYVSQGQHVTEGQLIAELDPKSAEVTLEQAKADLQAAEAKLVEEQETDGEGSASAGSNAGGSGASAAAASAAAASVDASAAAISPPAAGAEATKTAPAATTPAAQSTPAATAPAPSAAPTPASGMAQRTASKRSESTSQSTGSTPSTGASEGAGAAPSTRTSQSASGSGSGSGSDSTATQATVSAALREANIASAKAAVRGDALAVQSDEKALANTKLLAPQTGTLVSLSGEVGETVSGGGTTKSSSSSGSGSSSAGSGASAASSLGAGAATGGGSSDSSGSGSSSSSFAVLSNLSSMQLVVPLSESEVGSVRSGQPATVTVEALESAKLAAHVLSVATLPTSTSGVVSYDVTFQLDQLASGLKPGMSATAEVVVKQAEGVNVPTTAISADTVTVVRAGKQVRQRVVTGLAGDSSTIVLGGLKAGEEIVLPVARSSASGLASRLGNALSSRLGAGALGGGGGGLAGAGAAPGGGGFAGGGGFRGG